MGKILHRSKSKVIEIVACERAYRLGVRLEKEIICRSMEGKDWYMSEFEGIAS
jgi:hypothetical protein